MSEASGIRALVAGHGDFAAGLISAVEAVTGRGELLEPIQVKGLCGEDIEQLLRERLQATGALVIFTDLQAGSCTMAARRLLRDQPAVVLVSGTNLPMLLDFVMSSAPTPHDAAHAAVDRARSAIAAYGGPRDACALPHRRPADPRSGRRRMGTAARRPLHRARRRRRRRERLGAGAVPHGRSPRDGRALPLRDRSGAAAGRLPHRAAPGNPPHR